MAPSSVPMNCVKIKIVFLVAFHDFISQEKISAIMDIIVCYLLAATEYSATCQVKPPILSEITSFTFPAGGWDFNAIVKLQ